ncbi:hypothetical protein CAAN3_17S02366 [[Candida] anglica]
MALSTSSRSRNVSSEGSGQAARSKSGSRSGLNLKSQKQTNPVGSVSGSIRSQTDGESIYSFESVSTNGRLLDRLGIESDYTYDDGDEDEEGTDWNRRASTYSVQSTGRLLDRLGLEDDKTNSSGSSLHQQLQQIGRRVSHLGAQRNKSMTAASRVGVQRAPSAPLSSTTRYGAPTQTQPQQKHFTPPQSSEYNVGQVSGNTVAATDNQSIWSLHADMASLESVATISQIVSIHSNESNWSSGTSGSSEASAHTIHGITTPTPPETPKGHRKTNSLPEPDLDELAFDASEDGKHIENEDEDDEDEFRFTSASTSPIPNSPVQVSSQTHSRTPSNPPPPLPYHSPSSFNSGHLPTTSPTPRRILSEPITSPNKFPKQDMSPPARTALAIQLRQNGNHREASYQLQLAANTPNNYPHAMFLYAMALRFGQGVRLNESNSLKWLMRCLLVSQNDANDAYAAKLANVSPEDMILVMNRSLQAEDEVDPGNLYEYYSKLPAPQLGKIVATIKANQNIGASAFHEVGNCLINGWGLPNKDEMLGMTYLAKAASMGSFVSMAQLGELWSTKSKHHKKDYFKASAWLRLSELFGQKSIGNSWIYKDKYMYHKK